MSKTATARDVMDAERAIAFRVERQFLGVRAPEPELIQVVRRLVGVQSQVASASVAQLAARVDDLSAAHVERALDDGRLGRAWNLRSTIHVFARDDHRLLAGALGPGVGDTLGWLRRSGLDERLHAKLREAVLEALDEGPQSRSDLRARIASKLDGASDFFGSWGGVMKLFALEGLVALGPRRGAETTFVRADRWQRAPRPRHPAAELLARYLAAFGPARATDFSYWSGLSMKIVRGAFERLGDRVVPVALGGVTHFLLEEDREALRDAPEPPLVRLLPSFDVFLLGHRDKTLVVDAKHRKAVFRTAGWISQTVLVRGRVAGVWQSKRARGALAITARPLGRAFTKDVKRAIATEAERFSLL